MDHMAHSMMGEAADQDDHKSMPCGPMDDGDCEICYHLSTFAAKTQKSDAAWSIQPTYDFAVVEKNAPHNRQVVPAKIGHLWSVQQPPPTRSPVLLNDRLLN